MHQEILNPKPSGSLIMCILKVEEGSYCEWDILNGSLKSNAGTILQNNSKLLTSYTS